MKITLCGSARFEEDFQKWDERLSLCGHLVYTLSVYPSVKGDKDWYTPTQKMKLDNIHLAKIRESDAILVLNVGGYIGESTAKEITYAQDLGKKVFWLEAPKDRENQFIACDREDCPNPLEVLCNVCI